MRLPDPSQFQVKRRDEMKRSRKLPGLMPPYDEGVRIYTVTAVTVQNPLTYTAEGFCRLTPDSRTIVQPYGRMAAQHGHVVSKVRVKMALNMVFVRPQGKKTGPIDFSPALEPITTISLQCRDSLELWHVMDLLREADLEVEEFLDDNPEYGPGRVRTAISTYPVYSENVIGITDYLPLLRPPKD
jgi:hypothetical protein